jgi:hypothetical protein
MAQASESPQTESAGWKTLDPTDMSLEQLQDASAAVSAAFLDAQGTVNQLNNARVRILGEIGKRFGTDLPGVPTYAQLPPYPLPFVHDYNFVAPEPEPSDAPPAPAS